jgi:hypothetical protein
MTDIPLAARLSALNLHRIPKEDGPDLERQITANDAAAARVRAVAFSYFEEPSNVFRLSPAGKGPSA